MARVDLERVCVDLSGRRVLHDLNARIDAGALVAVVGPSGSGKTTLLRAVAGLESVSHGHIRFDGDDVVGLSAQRRDIGMVFQDNALLPRRSVRGNVEFPLELRRETVENIRKRVDAEARSLQIEHLLERDPNRLSRGEQQLVQIARTMVRAPKVLLLDEPFAPLDAHLRTRMRSEIALLQLGYGVTTIVATNDPDDAFALASEVVVLGGEPATVVQTGSPGDVRDEPASLEIATTLGPLAVLEVRVRADERGYWLRRDGAVDLRSWSPSLQSHVGDAVLLGVRPGGLVRDARGEATVEIVRRVAGSPGTLVCRWGGRMTTASGSASDDELGSAARFRIERPLVFEPTSGARIC